MVLSQILLISGPRAGNIRNDLMGVRGSRFHIPRWSRQQPSLSTVQIVPLLIMPHDYEMAFSLHRRTLDLSLSPFVSSITFFLTLSAISTEIIVRDMYYATDWPEPRFSRNETIELSRESSSIQLYPSLRAQSTHVVSVNA